MKKQKNKNSKVRTALHVLLAGVAAATVTTPIVLSNMDQSSIEVEQKKEAVVTNPFVNRIGYYSKLPVYMDEDVITQFKYSINDELKNCAYIKGFQTHDYYVELFDTFYNSIKSDYSEATGYQITFNDELITDYSTVGTGYSMNLINASDEVIVKDICVFVIKGLPEGSTSLSRGYALVAQAATNPLSDINNLSLDFMELGFVSSIPFIDFKNAAKNTSNKVSFSFRTDSPSLMFAGDIDEVTGNRFYTVDEFNSINDFMENVFQIPDVSFQQYTLSAKETMKYYALSNFNYTKATTTITWAYSVSGYASEDATEKTVLFDETTINSNEFSVKMQELLNERKSWTNNNQLFLDNFSCADSSLTNEYITEPVELRAGAEKEPSLLETNVYTISKDNEEYTYLDVPYSMKDCSVKEVLDKIYMSGYSTDICTANGNTATTHTESIKELLNKGYALSVNVYDTDMQVVQQIPIHIISCSMSYYFPLSNYDIETNTFKQEFSLSDLVMFDINHDGIINASEMIAVMKLKNPEEPYLKNVFADADGNAYVIWNSNTISINNVADAFNNKYIFDSEKKYNTIHDLVNLNLYKLKNDVEILSLDDFEEFEKALEFEKLGETGLEKIEINPSTATGLVNGIIAVDSTIEAIKDAYSKLVFSSSTLAIEDRYFQATLYYANNLSFTINLERKAFIIEDDIALIPDTFTYSSSDNNGQIYTLLMQELQGLQIHDSHSSSNSAQYDMLDLELANNIILEEGQDAIWPAGQYGFELYGTIVSTGERIKLKDIDVHVNSNAPIINAKNLSISVDAVEALKFYGEASETILKEFGVTAVLSNGLAATNDMFNVYNYLDEGWGPYWMTPGTYQIDVHLVDPYSSVEADVSLELIVLEHPKVDDNALTEINNTTYEFSLEHYSTRSNIQNALLKLLNDKNYCDNRGKEIEFEKDLTSTYPEEIMAGDYSFSIVIKFTTGYQYLTQVKVKINEPTPVLVINKNELTIDIEMVSTNLIQMFGVNAIIPYLGNPVDADITVSCEEDFYSTKTGGTFTIVFTASNPVSEEVVSGEATLIVNPPVAPEVADSLHDGHVIKDYKVGTDLQTIIDDNVLFADKYLPTNNGAVVYSKECTFENIDITEVGTYTVTCRYTNKYDLYIDVDITFNIVNRLNAEFYNLQELYTINLSDLYNGADIVDYLKDVKLLGINDEELSFTIEKGNEYNLMINIKDTYLEELKTYGNGVAGGLGIYATKEMVGYVYNEDANVLVNFKIKLNNDIAPLAEYGDVFDLIEINSTKRSLEDILKNKTLLIYDYVDGRIYDYTIVSSDYQPGVVGEYTYTVRFTNSAGLYTDLDGSIKVIDITPPVNTDGIKPIYYTYKKQDVYAVLNGIYMIDDTDGVITNFTVTWDNYSPATEYGTYQVEVSFKNKAGLKTYATTTICYQKKVSFWQKIKNWFKKVDNSSFGQFWRHPIAKIKSWF